MHSTPTNAKVEYRFGSTIPFALLHLGVIGVFFVPFKWQYLLLLAATYFIRMFGVTAGYHRYFSHRAYKLNRVNQFLMAWLAQSSAQKGALWWAAHHRDHHQYSDTEKDIHSPRQFGFWWSHVGWIVSTEYDKFEPKRIQDFGKYPELRWLNTWHWVPAAVLGAAIYLIGGVGAFVWGFVLSTVLLYHGTFTINSLCHVWGWKRFRTGDDSRNNFWLALLTMGEGWHNNHHKHMYAARQGMRWWEIDLTYYVLKALSWVGVTRDLRGFRLPKLLHGQNQTPQATKKVITMPQMPSLPHLPSAAQVREKVVELPAQMREKLHEFSERVEDSLPRSATQEPAQ